MDQRTRRRSVTVIGAGIVGLAAAYHLWADDVDVTVVDRDPEGDKASFGNAGGIAVTEVVPAATPGVAWRLPRWLLDANGPLSVRLSHLPHLLPWLVDFAKRAAPGEVERIATALQALNGRAFDDLEPMLSAAGLSGTLYRRGALTVYASESGFRRDGAEWDLKRRHGVTAEVVSGADARALEPALSSSIVKAVFTPQWAHVADPKVIVDGLRSFLSRGGVRIVRGHARHVGASAGPCEVILDGGSAIGSDVVVVAGGAWSGALARGLGDRVLMESERGYNTTIPEPGVSLTREVIFAEHKFVATPLSCGLRIGGAAEFGGLKAGANYARARTLTTLARRYLPTLRTDGTVWAGHRPTTPDSLPVIGASPRCRTVIYAFGHGHLGLTQAATTGRLVADLVAGRACALDLSPFSIARFG